MRPAALYVGRTTHQRLAPKPHRFSYDLFQVLLDVDRLAEAVAGLRLFRLGRFGLFSFTVADHGARDGSALRAWVEQRLTDAGITASARTIRLLTFPRMLGFVFNPLSIFFVHDDDDRLEAVIYEVNNTFGQTHAYVAPASGGEREEQSAEKVFYVSPFFRVEGGYRFRLSAPGERFSLTIVKEISGQADFIASQLTLRRPLTDAHLLRLSLTMPLMTFGVVAAIHWEALRLWIKGAPFGARPAGPKAGMSAGHSRPPRPIEARLKRAT
jgi:DUF1365 family protein